VTVSGTAQEGQTLTATPSGAVTGYQWQSLIVGGNTWTNISGATSSTYLVQEADEGHPLRVHVTSSGGSADSAATSAVIDISPTLTTPVISGTAQQGQTLTATAAVANDSDATVSYQWAANHGSGFVNIAGATSLSYVIQSADIGAQLEIVATSTDPDGTGKTTTSAATATVSGNGSTPSSLFTASASPAETSPNEGQQVSGANLATAGVAGGINDLLNLADLAFGTNSNNTGGTLTVSDGTNTANLALLGQYTAASFAMATDGSGGTLIHDPPATLAQTLTHPPQA
jgi:hypothetical protein